MKIIISPAKKMNADPDGLPWRDLPQFLPQTENLLRLLQEKDYDELKKLWKCNDQIAALNVSRLARMDLNRGLTPALFSYEGIQDRYMAPRVFTGEELDYVQKHLRILSGFYGLLRPFDGVTPYRLEMQAKLTNCNGKDLYGYWGNGIYTALTNETDCIINLASKEYSLCVSRYRTEDVRLITCVFGEEKDGAVIEKGTMCKMARGEMVRFMAENQTEDPEEIKSFDRLGYRFAPTRSDRDTYVFVKETSAPCSLD